jgi:peptidoglycan/xylan/chitin deacetylase (PgdA/CDA1 family)
MQISNLPKAQKFGSVIKRSTAGLVAAALMFSLVIADVPHAYASTSAAPRVSFTFDDGLTSAITDAAPTLAKYGFSGTNYVISDCIGMTTAPNTCHANNDATYMSLDQIKQLQSQFGWEIGSHTKSHPYLASSDADDGQPNVLTSQQVSDELTTSKLTLNNDGFSATDFATPYGDWTPAVLAQIAKTYASHRGFADSIDQGTTPDGIIDHGNTFPYNDYLLYDYQVQAGVTVAQVKSMIDQTITNNQWLVLTFHDIKPAASTNPDDYEYNTADLDQIAAYVKSKGIEVTNINGSLANGTNIMPNSSFDATISSDINDTTSWSTDDPTNIKQNTGNNGSYPSSTNSVELNGTTKNIELFSPRVAVDENNTYVIKNYLNVANMTVAAGHEIAFYFDEYDANGTYLGATARYMKSEVGNAGSPTGSWVENLNFTYKPSAGAKFARMQVVTTANSGAKVYLDNVQMFAESATSPVTPPVVIPPTTGGQGGGSVAGKTGDLTGDGKVNIQDLSILLSHWKKSGMSGNLDGNPEININDLSILLANWG